MVGILYISMRTFLLVALVKDARLKRQKPTFWGPSTLSLKIIFNVLEKRWRQNSPLFTMLQHSFNITKASLLFRVCRALLELIRSSFLNMFVEEDIRPIKRK